jgi:TetR/AcrR family transcriptional regulator, regulator of cefoperazone and chloramphenicol sensitivity
LNGIVFFKQSFESLILIIMKKKPATKERLIITAREIFAEKGFRDTTVAEICEQAEANIAAVNYHFGDKESLYDAVWRNAFTTMVEAYPLDGELPDDPSTEDRLFAFANAMVHRMFCETEAGFFPKLLCQEMAAPTLALDRIAKEALFPQHQYVGAIIRDATEDQLSDTQFQLCLHGIIGQCVFFNFSRPLRERMMGKKKMSEQSIEKIARHITRFSLGGIKAIQS